VTLVTGHRTSEVHSSHIEFSLLFSVNSTALCVYYLLMSRVYLLSNFNINVDIVQMPAINMLSYLVPMTAAKEVDSCLASAENVKILFLEKKYKRDRFCAFMF